ncbi:ankyrin repeat domain-containing protein [Skeletonema marinoi]|uniref:Ankyrin repeat domain-containing protein n=1 Tax=Skeletonema marinoi TaxID=267567 RepID=A0AAD9D6B9_9STRA|nr:ankyrin repeat domain-containing protein [Skeletonema marinoi]
MTESGSNNDSRQSAVLLSKELRSYCQSESLSEEGLREMIERHPNNNHVGDYEFFLEACYNERVTVGIIQYLLEYFPVAISDADEDGHLPLHLACQNPNVTPEIIQLLVDAAPDSLRSVTNNGHVPLHYFCDSKDEDDRKAMQILKLLIERQSDAVRHVDNDGFLPIHHACAERSPEFCRLLVEAYPGSEGMSDSNGMLPLHFACMTNTVATVEYLYKLYPDAIKHTTTDGYYPVHFAMKGAERRDNPIAAVGDVKYLLDCDPSVKFQKVNGLSLLEFACQGEFNDKIIEAALKVIETIYDAHPEAIESNRIASNIQWYHQRIQAFLNGELVYARQARDHRLMTTPDGNGQLPLHTALQNNVKLGSIKLLVKGNPPAVQSTDNSGALPLHVACQHHESADVIQYLVGLDITTLDAVDRDGNTALHFACHCARHEFIALLLGKYNGVSVSKRNAHGKLPIDLLWESNVVLDRDSVEYTESVFRLLKAYPEMVMTTDMQTDSVARLSQNRKKRKFDHEE